MAALTPDGMTFKEVFMENTHLADSKRQVKKYILIRTPAEISRLRRFHCPRINYENRQSPGEYKTKLCADDVALGRYKYVPVRYPTEKERKRILRKRQKLEQQSVLKTPKIQLSDEKNESDKENDKEDGDKHEDSDFGVVDDSPILADSLLSSRQLTSAEIKGIKAMRKWQRKTFHTESDGSSDDGDDDSSFDEEYKGYLDKINREKVLTTPDFDTDFQSTEESEREEYIDTKGRKRRKKLTQPVKNYYRSCAKCHMRPNRSFFRQCGKATVDIRHRMLNHKDAKPIAITLVNDKKTSFLDISYNPLGPLGTSHIAQMLSKNDNIVELNLSSTFPQREGLQALLEALRTNHTLHRLYLDDNELLPSDGEVIGQMIMDLPELLEMHLANNNLGFEGTKCIGKALATSKGKLNVLNLRYNNIRTDTAVQFALSLVKNKTLRSLDLSWNGFGNDGVKSLAFALEKNNTLKDLDLTCNRVGIKSLGFLLEGLMKNKGLLCIKLGSNPLTTEGAKALVAAITETKTSTLTEIDLRGIPVDEEFFELKTKLVEDRTIRVHHDSNIHLGTSDVGREGDGTFLDNYDPVMVMFEFMKKDNLRVIDFFQFFDVRKRDKLSKGDLANGFNILLIPFTQHQIDTIMKKLDRNKDGFISLEETMKGYNKSDKQVKLRRIKASKNKTKDEGLENLWVYLKGLIIKRKEENMLKTAINSEIRRSSLLPGADNSRKGSLFAASPDGRRGSIFPGGGDGRKGSLFPGGEGSGRRGSLFPMGEGGRRGSLFPGGSLLPGGDNSRRGSGDGSRASLLLAAAAASGGLLNAAAGGGSGRRGSLFPMLDSNSPRGSLFAGSSREGRRGSWRLSGVDETGSPGSLSRRGSGSNSVMDGGGGGGGGDRRGSGANGMTQGSNNNRPDMILEAEDSSIV